jgi:hypothetical protein
MEEEKKEENSETKDITIGLKLYSKPISNCITA